MIDAILKAVVIASCVSVLAVVEPALNRVTLRTRRCIRISLLLIGSGAMLTAASTIPGAMPSPWLGAAALSFGIALMLFTSRRRKIRNYAIR